MYKRSLLLAPVLFVVIFAVVSAPRVHAAGGTPPAVTVSVSTSIQLPTATASVSGTATAQSGATIVSTTWTQTAGPRTATIVSPSSLSTSVSDLSTAGTYEFKLAATDSSGLSSSAATQIIVKAAAATQTATAETPPTVSAGADQAIILPQSSLTVSGTVGVMQGATVSSVTWVEQSGPATVSFANEHANSTTASGLTAVGTYVLEFSAKDSNGNTASDKMMVTVSSSANSVPPDNSSTNPPPSNSVGSYTGQNTNSNTVGKNTLTLTVTPPQDISLPEDTVTLHATTSISFAGSGFTEVSGPAKVSISTLGWGTVITGLDTVGTYVFQAKSSVYNNSLVTYATTTVTVLGDNTKPGDVPYTANTKVPTPTEPYAFGTNTGVYHSTQWQGSAIYDLISMIGGHATRTTLPDSFITAYGDMNYPYFVHFGDDLGFKGNVLFIGEPSSADQSTTTYDGIRSKLWKGMYDPIWGNGSNGTPINPNNTLAEYVYKLVKKYGPYVSYWEIINEPDYTYAPNTAAAGPTGNGNWWTNMPQVDATPNLNAPVTAYVRVLRVAYEIIKKYDPNSLVCPGGLGYPSYLDAILRYTDNPDGGTVTSQYPLTGGAYMDCLSWHFYPEYRTRTWVGYSAPGNIDGFQYSRNSDYTAVTAFSTSEAEFEQVLQAHGYGTTYPAKVQIVTENGMASRQISSTETGGLQLQGNFTIKATVEAQRMGLSQMFWYGFAGNEDPGDSSVGDFQLMQLVDIMDKNGNALPQPLLTPAGVANLTMSNLLYGWKYDAVQSAKLQLPSNLDGAAFSKNGQYRYVLWAKTTKDDSEAASGSYSFPPSLGITSLQRIEWDYSHTGKVTMVGPSSIALSGNPSFFIPAGQTLPATSSLGITSETASLIGSPSSSSSTGGSNSGGSTGSSTGNSTQDSSGGSTSVSSVGGSTSGTSASSEGQSSTSSSVSYVTPNTSKLNVRATPNGKIIGLVTPSDTGTVLWSSPVTPWEEVSFSNGLSGYVYNSYLKTEEGTPVASSTTGSTTSQSNGAAQIIITTPALRVRSTPNGTILGVAKEGDRGTVISESSDGSWLEVQFPTYTGYVYKQYTVPIVAPTNTNSSTSETATSTTATVTVNTSKLHVRETPNGTIIGLVTPSDTGTVLWSSPATPWEEVSFSNGLSGFVYRSYLSTASSASVNDQFAVGSLVMVNTSKLHVRSSPNGTVIGHVTLGEEGTVSATSGMWVKATFPNGISGYVFSSYLINQ